MESISWQLIALFAQFAIIIAGFVTARSLSGKRKERHLQKFMVGSFVPIILTFLYPPYIYNRSFAESSWKADYTEVVSLRDAEKRIADHAAQIDRLNEETTRLRRDLSEANDYYRRFANYSIVLALAFCGAFVFRKGSDEVDSIDESPLGLRSDKDE